jgi:tRNA(Ile)-lysidine synthase
LRGEESDGDEAFVRSLCTSLHVPLSIIRIKQNAVAAFACKRGCGIEAAARDLRYRALNRTARRFNAAYIATAHTRNDMLETLLMRVLRGSGPVGLSPMRPVSAQRNGVTLLRPMLNVSREQMLCFLREKNQTWREDSSNSDNQYLRNRIRNKLVPLLDSEFPSWQAGVLAMGETQGLVAECVRGFIAETQSIAKTQRDGEGVRYDNFFSLPQFLREELVFKIFDEQSHTATQNTFEPDPPPHVKPPRRQAVRQFCAGEASSIDLGLCTLTRNGDALCIKEKQTTVSAQGMIAF